MTESKILTIRNKEETHLCSGIYSVPTPIGNIRDITLRALDVLTHCDVIVCEDSRVTGQLLKFYDIPKKKKIIYNDHAVDDTKNYILNLARDNIIALVSDAGTPMISDPGYKLMRDAIAGGVYVTALPGANAILPALQLSGLPTDKFTFGGFLPSKQSGVQQILKTYQNHPETLIFYDTAKRLEKTLMVLTDIYPTRQISVVREISKLYEESLRGTATEILASLTDKIIKGEIVLVIEGASATDDSIDIDQMIANAIKGGQSAKDIATELSAMTGVKKKDIYNRVLTIQDK